MSASIGFPPQSTAPSDIVASVKSRIMSGAALSSMQVRIVADPNPTQDPYVAEKHIDIRISPPNPIPTSGAGRHGYKVSRDIILFVFTESMLDVAGSDEIAVKSHLDFEDTLIDIMIDERPPALQQMSGEKQGIRGFRYVGPGSNEPQRIIGNDSALLVSTMVFNIEYVTKTRVLQGT